MTNIVKSTATAGWKLSLPATNVKDGAQITLRPWIAAIPDEMEARAKFAESVSVEGAYLEPLTASDLAPFDVPPGEVRKA